MRVCQILAKVIGVVSESMDPRRRRLLTDLVVTLVSCPVGTVTSLGRALRRPSSEKHAIKRADRALSNEHLHRESFTIWAAIARYVLRRNQRPIVLLDWSDAGQELAILRASVAFRGRSINVLTCSYPSKKKGNRRAETSFLEQLARTLPEGCRPVVVVDAGFQGAFFATVKNLGWDYIGRLRTNIWVRGTRSKAWRKTIELEAEARSKPRDLGIFDVTRRGRYTARLVSYDGRSHRARKKRPVRGRQQQRRARRREQKPLLLVTSLQTASASVVVATYRTRMQIELTFRDDKSSRFGAGLENFRCSSPRRLDVFMLLMGLATLVLTLLGALTHLRHLHRSMQANTVQDRPVLSLVALGRRFVARRIRGPSSSELARVADLLRAGINQWSLTCGDP